MKLSLLNKVATIGFSIIILATVIDIVIIVWHDITSVSAFPLAYKLIMTVCGWGAIALIGCVFYFCLKRYAKA